MISRGGPGPILPNGSLVIGTAHSGRLDIQLLSEQQSNTTIQYHDNVDSMSKILDIIDSCPDNSLPCLAVIGHGSSGGCAINNDRIDHFCSWMLSDESIDQRRQKLAPNAELHIYACSQFNVGGAADIQVLANRLGCPVICNEKPIAFGRDRGQPGYMRGQGCWVRVDPTAAASDLSNRHPTASGE